MKKKHIISFGFQDFACENINTATQAIALLSKLERVEWIHIPGGEAYYQPEAADKHRDLKLEMNQNYKAPVQTKPLALPKPKRGTILCICEKSHVAPHQSCAHCGRNFSESHNRTHSNTTDSGQSLRLL